MSCSTIPFPLKFAYVCYMLCFANNLTPKSTKNPRLVLEHYMYKEGAEEGMLFTSCVEMQAGVLVFS